MPLTPTPENPRGYADVRQVDVNMPNAVNSIKNEISRDVAPLHDVVGEQQPAIANAAPDGSDAAAKINAILAALRAHGLIAT